MCTKEEETVDKIQLLEWLFDTAKLLTELHHNQTDCRKSVIVPGLTRELKEVLKSTVPNKFLFGEGLAGKIKDTKALEKMGRDIKAQPKNLPPSINRPSTSRQYLNWRSPLGTKPYPRYAGNTQLPGQARPRLSFRGRRSYINPKINPTSQNRMKFRPKLQQNR